MARTVTFLFSVFWIILVFVLVFAIFDFMFSWYWMVFGVGIATIIGLAVFLLIWFKLAPRNMFFTFVSEGTAKIIVKGDQFSRCFIQWEGHTLDREGNVIEGKEPWHLFGGFRFYGIWPLFDVFIYRLRWNDIHRSRERDGNMEDPSFHDKWLDYVLLRPDVYSTNLQGAETNPSERLALNVAFNVTMQVVNPYKTIFVAPPNWVENVMVRLDAVLRGFIAAYTLDQLLVMRGDETGVWEKLGQDPFIQRTLQEWGILIPEGGIQMRDIGLPVELQTVAEAKRVEELRAEGARQAVLVAAEAEATRIDTVYGAVERHPAGQTIRALEALEKSPLAASVVVQMVPGLPGLLQDVFRRPPAEVSSAGGENFTAPP